MKKLFLIIGIVSSFLYSCEKDEKDPSVSMISAVAVSASSGKAVGKVDQTGDFKIIDHGFVYSLSSSLSNIEYSNIDPSNKVSLGNTIKSDTFAAILPLNSNNDYYYSSGYKYNVWAYITNEKGTVYSSKSVSFAPKQLLLQSVSPSVGKVGDTITITGTNFDTSISNIEVKFYYNYESYSVLARVVSASETALKVIVPNLTETSSYYSTTQFSIKVKMGENEMTLSNSFWLMPVPTGFSPKQGTFNTYITITGTQMQNISSVIFGNETVYISGSSSNSLTFYVPSGFKQKKTKIYIVKGGKQIEVPGGEFEMLPLTISSVSSLKVWPGDLVIISGSNFNTSYNGNIMLIGSAKLSSNYEWESSTSFYIPDHMVPGQYTVSISNGVDTVVMPDPFRVVVPSITNISPASVYQGNLMTITGHNFSNSGIVYIDGYSYDSSKHDSVSYEINVPALSPGTHTLEMHANGYNSTYKLTSKEFTVLAPTLASITPTSGSIGTSFVINGHGFGNDPYYVGVMFGNVSASVLSVNGTQINAQVPANTGSGTWVVSVAINGRKISDTVQFTIP